jgi:hypothetical protein
MRMLLVLGVKMATEEQRYVLRFLRVKGLKLKLN